MLQLMLSGFVSGLEIALLAVAFQIAYLPSGIFFLGLAGAYVATPYVYQACLGAAGNVPVAIVLSLALAAVISLGMERANHASLTWRRAPPAAHMISSLGLYIVLTEIVVLCFGDGSQSLRHAAGMNIISADLLTGSQNMSLAVSAALLCAFAILLEFTSLGLRLRALASNPRQFSLYGFDASKYLMAAFAISGCLAGASALLRANDSGFDPYVGLSALLLAVVAVIVGGRGSFLTPILGAIVLGVVRALIAWYFDARWQDPATFLILGLVLIVKPGGILSFKSRLESA